ncbi:hypothetical protein STENM327S_07789 [Streptomyces tendae]
MTTVSEGPYAPSPVAPDDRAWGQGLQQQLPELAPLHLGAASGGVIGPVRQDGAVRCHVAGRLAAFEDEGPEAVHQAGGTNPVLSVVVVDVEHAALAPGLSRRLRFVDRGRDSMNRQGSCQCQSR